MKIPSSMWSVILFNLKPEDHSNPSAESYILIKVAKLNQYEHLKKEHPFSDTIWDICNDLKEINLEYNSNLKDLFFKHWKDVDYNEKLRVFKNVDTPNDEKFTPEIKKYLIKNMINYPTVMELNKFRKEMSQEDLKRALNNFYNQIQFHKFGNQKKEDYWANHIPGKEEDKLLDLIELSGMKKEELINFNKIGFFNEARQARYDKIIEEESKLPLLESTGNQVYLITTKINPVILLKEESKLGATLISTTAKYMSAIIKNVMNTENVEEIKNNNINHIKFITEDKKSYENSLLKMKGTNEWLENNQLFLIKMSRKMIKENKNLMDFKEETKELADKIILHIKLENKLIDKEFKNKTIKKI